MNVFSNIGITELLVILLLALLVVGPERLPELGRQLGKLLRDVRRAYDNLTRDLGPELAEIQRSTQELRESVESVRSIPQDIVQTVVQAADLDDTVQELKEMSSGVQEVGETLSAAGKAAKDPLGAAVEAARNTLDPRQVKEAEETPEEATDGGAAAGNGPGAGEEAPAATSEAQDAAVDQDLAEVTTGE